MIIFTKKHVLDNFNIFIIEPKKWGKMIECKICQKELKNLSALISHLQKHKIKKSEYIEKFGNLSETSSCKICKKEISKKRTYCSNKCKFSDTKYNQSRSPKIKNIPGKILKCKLCGWETSDLNNLGGNLTRHAKIHGKSLEEIKLEFEVRNSEEVDLFKCPLCEWTSKDFENKSGWFTTHLKKVHNLNPYEFIQTFPEYRKLWKMYFNQSERNDFLKIKDNFVECKICGEKFKFITNSHLKIHKITQKEYKDNYGEILSETTKNILKENYASGLGLFKGNYVSKAEIEIFNFLTELGITNINSRERSLINPFELDLYLPDNSLAIEFDGLYWHSELNGKTKDYHLLKTMKCEEMGVQLIHIFEDEWINKKEIVKLRLKHILQKSNDKIFARKCEVRELNSKEKNEFLIQFHIQGTDKSKIKIGLFSNDKLISVMTFGSLRSALGSKHQEGVYEMQRFASNTNVIGGASKLLKYFIRNYQPEKIISYADRRWSRGNLYQNLGFLKISDGGPNYWYLDGYNKRLHRFNFTKSVILQKLNGDPNLTEWENMQKLGYDRIWDCGSLKYELNLK